MDARVDLGTRTVSSIRIVVTFLAATATSDVVWLRAEVFGRESTSRTAPCSTNVHKVEIPSHRGLVCWKSCCDTWSSTW